MRLPAGNLLAQFDYRKSNVGGLLFISLSPRITFVVWKIQAKRASPLQTSCPTSDFRLPTRARVTGFEPPHRLAATVLAGRRHQIASPSTRREEFVMCFKRSLSALVVAVLLLTSGAAGILAQIEGETWTSPTYGFSVSWAGTEWQPDPAGTLTAVGPERLDRIHLLNGVSSLYFEGATRYEGDLTACVAEEANLLAQETGVSEIRPYRDDEGVQLIAGGPNSSAAAFTLTLSIGDQEVELVDYVECRTLIPGQAVLIITLVAEPPVFDQELAAAQTVIDTIVLSEETPLDPLAAWVAGGRAGAAKRRRSALR
jgi:hypothetical protein